MRSFAILWMSEKALAETYDLDGAFNAVSIKLLRNARPEPVMEAVDNLLDRYGGLTAFARKDQQSHAFLDAELNQLAAMSRILPFRLAGASPRDIRAGIGIMRPHGVRRPT